MMMGRSGSTLNELKALHRELDSKLSQLNHHARLTPPEERLATELKKHKLSTKDEIVRLESQPPPPLRSA
jgi:hypothetical protein